MSLQPQRTSVTLSQSNPTYPRQKCQLSNSKTRSFSVRIRSKHLTLGDYSSNWKTDKWTPKLDRPIDQIYYTYFSKEAPARLQLQLPLLLLLYIGTLQSDSDVPLLLLLSLLTFTLFSICGRLGQARSLTFLAAAAVAFISHGTPSQPSWLLPYLSSCRCSLDWIGSFCCAFDKLEAASLLLYTHAVAIFAIEITRSTRNRTNDEAMSSVRGRLMHSAMPFESVDHAYSHQTKKRSAHSHK